MPMKHDNMLVCVCVWGGVVTVLLVSMGYHREAAMSAKRGGNADGEVIGTAGGTTLEGTGGGGGRGVWGGGGGGGYERHNNRASVIRVLLKARVAGDLLNQGLGGSHSADRDEETTWYILCCESCGVKA